MNPDLHCHSSFSDGNHSPDFLLSRAAENGVTHLAITDHDCTTALEIPLVEHYGVTLIPGVEISCQWETWEVHLVGLGIEINNPELQNLLREQQIARKQRMELIAEQLRKHDADGLMEYLHQLPCTAYTRSHAADFLVNSGKAKNKQSAFKKFLGKKAKAYVPFQWQSLTKAITTIRSAAGLAVLAHPGRYSFSKRKLESFIEVFSESGGDAIEASYGGIDPVMQKKLEGLAERNCLSISVGSDFHNADAHWTDIGKYPRPSATAIKNAIWNHPRWHF
ncbi:MAG: PHP domain-containing protein [Gammaproteobacteria bacterium]|nr:PHP domain-containing protein [Gammaproteobacteria bacterium]MDD9894438.1 PHP domain-containing protein [Gammaproteobacteria bacterium]